MFRGGSLVVIFSVLLAQFKALALPPGFDITIIASNSGENTFPFYGWPAINESGVVCFHGASPARSAILKGNGILRQTVADTTSGVFPIDQFSTGICSINNAGDVAFDGCRNCTPPSFSESLPSIAYNPSTASDALPIEYGIYKMSTSGIPFIIQESGGNADSFTQVSLPTINDAGEVSFTGELNNGLSGVWIKAGSTLLNPINSSGQLAEVGGAFMNDARQLTFGANEDSGAGESGIYGSNSERIIGTFNGFTQVSLSVINNNGDIAAMGVRQIVPPQVTAESGVYLNGAPHVLAQGDFAGVDISAFQGISLNDNGDIVFPGFRPNRNPVIFFAAEGGIVPLVEKGDLIPGYTSPVSLASVSREALNNSRQIALNIVLQDNVELVIRFDPNGFGLPTDECPEDNLKFSPGICGCGRSDADSNADGILDCFVTQNVKQLAINLLSSVQTLKKLPPSPSKLQKSKNRASVKAVKTVLAGLFSLVQGSAAQITLAGGTKTPLQLATSLRRDVLKACKTGDSSFPSNKRVALRALNKFVKLLVEN